MIKRLGIFTLLAGMTISLWAQYTADLCTGGTASASSTFESNYASNAFDNSEATRWASEGTVPQWLRYNFGTGKTIKQYRFLTTWEITGMCLLQSWTLEGSNDGSSWSTIHTVSGASLAINTWYTYNTSHFTNNTSYQYYRIYVTAAVDGYVDIVEMEMMAAAATTPTITTSAASSVGNTSATMGGNISSDGGATVTGRGVVYSSTDATPTIGEDGVTQDTNGDGTSSFSESIGSLSSNVTYYFQAYAINSAGTAYGGVQNFTTTYPEINLTQGSTSISDGGSYDFGTKNAGGNTDIIFTIENTGTGTLTLSGSPIISIAGTNADQFSVQSQPGSATISASGNTTFSIRFSPTTGGAKVATIAIASDDANESEYNLTLNGTGSASVTFTDGSAYSPSAVCGNSNQVFGRFLLSGDVSGANLTAISVRLDGARTGVSNIKLWSSADESFDGGTGTDLQLGSTLSSDPGDGSTASFSSFASSISSSGIYYFVTGDLAVEATGVIQGVIIENASLTLTYGSLSGLISNAVLSSGDVSLPVELDLFEASYRDQKVLLKWCTASETENLGFILEKRQTEMQDWTEMVSFVKDKSLRGQGNSSIAWNYSYIDAEVTPGEKYYYRLSDVSYNGEITVLQDLIVCCIALSSGKNGITALSPNPFNAEITLRYSIEEPLHVRLLIIDLTGRIVRTLTEQSQSPGEYTLRWDGTSDNGQTQASGVYFLILDTSTEQFVRKLILVR